MYRKYESIDWKGKTPVLICNVAEMLHTKVLCALSCRKRQTDGGNNPTYSYSREDKQNSIFFCLFPRITIYIEELKR